MLYKLTAAPAQLPQFVAPSNRRFERDFSGSLNTGRLIVTNLGWGRACVTYAAITSSTRGASAPRTQLNRTGLFPHPRGPVYDHREREIERILTVQESVDEE